MLTHKYVLTVASALMGVGAVAPVPAEAFGDGPVSPPLVEGTYAFECPGIRATVRYRQERHEPESVPRLEDGMRVTLLELTVSGARVSAEQFASAGEVFRSFASVSNVSALCAGGRASLDVRGMPHGPFMDALRDDEDGLPDLITRSIGLPHAD